MRGTYVYDISKSRCYGFTHTSSEAVQQIKFLFGEYTPHYESWNLIARGKDFTQFLDAPYTEADAYIVEISSTKLLKLEDDCIQLNYLINEFTDFFSDKTVAAAYWRLVTTGNQTDQTDIDAFLDEHWSHTEEQKAQTQTLRRIRRSLMTDEEIRSDIRYLINRLPNVLFITHVDAKKPDGSPIPSRSKLIQSLSQIVEEEGGKLYNPTFQMEKQGQEYAIEDHSDALAHYTEDFSKLIFKDWYTSFLSPTFDSIAQNLEDNEFIDKCLPHYEAMIEEAEINDLSSRLKVIADSGINRPELYALIALTNEMEGKDEAALDSLKRSLQGHPDHIPTLKNCIELQINLKIPLEAKSHLEHLYALGETLNNDLIYDLAKQLKEREERQLSCECLRKILYSSSPIKEAADLFIDLIGAAPNANDEVDEHLLSVLLKLLPPQRILEIGIDVVDYEIPNDVSRFINDSDKSDIQSYMRILLSKKEFAKAFQIASRTEPSVSGNLKSLEHTDPSLAHTAQLWLDQIDSISCIASKYHEITRAKEVFPNLRETRIKFRECYAELTAHIRNLYRSQEITLLTNLTQQLNSLGIQIFDAEFLLGKLLFTEQNYEKALSYCQRATFIDEEHFLAQVLTMRCAFRNDDLLSAKNAADKILALNEPDSDKLQDEARLVLSRIPKKALMLSRSTDNFEHKVKLLQLAALDSSQAPKVDPAMERLERDWVKDLVTAEKSGAPDILEIGYKIEQFFPSQQRVHLIMGRTLNKKGDFEAASNYWQKLLQVEPDNPNYKLQVERCKSRLAKADSINASTN